MKEAVVNLYFSVIHKPENHGSEKCQADHVQFCTWPDRTKIFLKRKLLPLPSELFYDSRTCQPLVYTAQLPNENTGIL